MIELISITPQPKRKAIEALEAVKADWLSTGTITGRTLDKVIAALAAAGLE